MHCSEQSFEAAQTIIVCAASSFGWMSLLTPVILIASLCVAIFGVRSARASARQRATLDMIEKVESTPHYRGLHSVFSYHRRQSSFYRLHNPREEKDRQERQAVLDYLNHYELVAIGICNRILDADFYRDWMLGPFVRDWNAAAEFIQRERWKWDVAKGEWRYHGPLFRNFQTLACRWSSQAIVLDEAYSPPPDAPSGPGDEAYPVPRNEDGETS
ncbi:DUF4760 domain-containing protein [Amorphus coralli]|uniref:DUF4760 domain-containing protein n=1 Tax=Amorphus coralli TaxID=340680 RepID=UPI000367FF42|nr:DUF4760 domain-containing protein [Amorphus coralli]